MISGSTFLKEEVEKYSQQLAYLENSVGFPDAAVDRIVPMQQHDDPLLVQVEPFCGVGSSRSSNEIQCFVYKAYNTYQI